MATQCESPSLGEFAEIASPKIGEGDLLGQRNRRSQGSERSLSEGYRVRSVDLADPQPRGPDYVQSAENGGSESDSIGPVSKQIVETDFASVAVHFVATIQQAIS